MKPVSLRVPNVAIGSHQTDSVQALPNIFRRIRSSYSTTISLDFYTMSFPLIMLDG